MSALGGPVRAFTIDGRRFAVQHDADVERDLSGFENEVVPTGMPGVVIVKQTAKTAMLSGLVLKCDDDQQDHEAIQNIANSGELKNATIAFANGRIWRGGAIPSGSIKYSSANSTLSCDFALSTLEAT